VPVWFGGRRFDVALFTFKAKPFVSIPFPQLQEYLDVVYKAKTPETFAMQYRDGHFYRTDKIPLARV